jgi:hypothetical protein
MITITTATTTHAVICYHCGAELGQTDGRTLIGPSFDLNKAIAILCKCGAKRFWCPDKPCGKIAMGGKRDGQ